MDAVIDRKQLACRGGKITHNQLWFEMLAGKQLSYSGSLGATRLWGAWRRPCPRGSRLPSGSSGPVPTSLPH